MNRGRRKAGLFPKFEKFLADAMQTGGTLFGNDLAITSAHANHVVAKRFEAEQSEKNSGVSRDGFGGFYYDPKKDKRTQYEKDNDLFTVGKIKGPRNRSIPGGRRSMPKKKAVNKKKTVKKK
jgi:hypothetical protein|tara:strand:- start:3799 stop:4164 length:366 start_codon:yes stop_codon:yes gene_type:complete